MVHQENAIRKLYIHCFEANQRSNITRFISRNNSLIIDILISLLNIGFGNHCADQNSNAFKEVAIIRHPRIGEYAFGFITSSTVILQQSTGEEQLCCVYVPSNHLYIGDIFLISSKDILRPNLSVREGIGIYDFPRHNSA